MIKKSLKWLVYALATLIILLAVLVSAARMLTPYFNKHLPNFEAYASSMFQKPVTIGNIYLSWSGLDPELVLQHVAIKDEVTKKPKISIRQINLDFGLLRSLFSLRPMLDQLKIWGIDFTVNQTAAGDFNLGGVGLSVSDTMTGSSVKTQDVLSWIFSQPKLVLHDINIEFINAKGNKLAIVLDNLSLHSLGTTHSLRGKAIVQQEVPTTVALELDWQGKMEDLKNVTASLYCYVEGVSLPDRLKQLSWQGWQVKQGIGSAKIWVAWSGNIVQNVQSNFQIYDLDVTSPTHQSRKVPRLSGNVIWRREGLNHIISGEDILIDLPKHLWPTVDFSLTLTPNKSNQLAIKQVKVNYLDLTDVSDWLRISQFATNDIYKTITAVNLRGDVENLAINLPVDVAVAANNTTISADINHFAIDAWNKYPGLQNLSGQLHWDGNQGILRLNSKSVRVNYLKFFQNNIAFDKISGELVFTQQPDAWTLNANQLQLTNEDVTGKTTFVLTSNPNSLPSINLSADFSVAKTEKLIHYLPTNLFSAELNRWLTPAFGFGQIESGTAFIEGNLGDFPFQANKKGKFVITSHVKNMEFNFAPNWPVIHKLNGKLTFEGQTLTADSDSGWIYDVPIKQAHAVMTNIGVPGPTILTIQSTFDTDLAKGLYFIHHSPLEMKVGSELSALDLSGKMQLNLFLNVPLAKLDNTTVKGDVLMNDAMLSVPDWNLAIEKLQGPFEFTESSINAASLRGSLFGENIQLVLSTRANNNQNEIHVNLNSHVNVTDIEKWLAVSLSKILQGGTNYQAELIVSHTKPAQVVLTTDLRGIAVNVPAPYGKSAAVPADFKLELKAGAHQPLETKLYYDKLVSAAANMMMINQKLHFKSGNIHLGGGEPELSAVSGISITGQMDEFDWDIWKNYFDSISTNKVTTSIKDMFANTWWQHVDLLINKLLLFGKELDQVRIQLTPLTTGLQIGLTTHDMDGQITLPNDPKAAVQAKFERLYFPALQGKVSQWNPKLLPPISFVGNDVRSGDKQLGRLTFNTTPIALGLSINNLTINTPGASLTATGSWKLNGDSYQTHLQGDLNTNNMSELIKNWGFVQPNLVSRKGDLNFNLNWADAPYNPNFAGMSGNASIKLGEGQIVNLSGSQNAQLGLARLLNILSVENLPRRLSGNFNDLTQKGYTFDYITGNFSFKAGDAYTSDLIVNGPMAKIDVAGRIGLAAKDLDLTVNVTPYVTSGLPLVATIATGFNPVAGVATWLVDKMVTQGVSNVVTYRYKVTGGWDKPAWQKV